QRGASIEGHSSGVGRGRRSGARAAAGSEYTPGATPLSESERAPAAEPAGSTVRRTVWPRALMSDVAMGWLARLAGRLTDTLAVAGLGNTDTACTSWAGAVASGVAPE
nr:hypothetical protein [Tanacetum cinerariifolium]